MSFLMALFYDRVMAGVEEACLREWRAELLGQVDGQVLEIGAGTGATIDFYPAGVQRLVLSEPDPHMRRRLERQVAERGRDDIEVVAGSAERIEAADESFDFAVTHARVLLGLRPAREPARDSANSQTRWRPGIPRACRRRTR